MKVILVVDDEVSIVETLCMLLEDEGYRCLKAPNGREALAMMEKQKPDLVITDVMMPVMDGRDLVRAIRANDAYKDVPIVLMSAARGSLDDEDLGHDVFLQKPFSLEQVIELITRLLQRRQTA